MADWRQIQARIRKAKNSQDPHAKLYELFQRTRDAMVAWELGAIEEKAGRNDEAARWYTTAAQRFRRADWKKKAEEALTRLGIELPVPEISPVPESRPRAAAHSNAPPESDEPDRGMQEAPPALAPGEIAEATLAAPEPQSYGTAAGAPTGDSRKKRRRGRRGGRGRRRKGAAGASPALPAHTFADSPSLPVPPARETPDLRQHAPERSVAVEAPPARASEASEITLPSRSEYPAPRLPSERTAHGRGDPALASRMAQLESMLRRLLSSQLHKVDEIDDAPAGPGVFLLSDSDQITSYYIEACQTLRVGIGNLVRGGRGARGPRGGRGGNDTNLKAKLADHLEISEAKVGQYLKDHCVVRWIQLDEDAHRLAHFAIAILRTPLNAD